MDITSHNVVQIIISRNFVCKRWRSKRVRRSDVMKNHKVVIGRGSGYISGRDQTAIPYPEKVREGPGESAATWSKRRRGDANRNRVNRIGSATLSLYASLL